MKTKKLNKTKLNKPINKEPKNKDVRSNEVKDSEPKRKKRSVATLEIVENDADQTEVKKIKLENTINKPDSVAPVADGKIEENKSKNVNLTVEELKEKIKILSNKDNLSKNARKNLAKLKKKLSVEENVSTTASPEKQLEEETTEEAPDSDQNINNEERPVEEIHSVQQLANDSNVTKKKKKNKNEVPIKTLEENADNEEKSINSEKKEENKKNISQLKKVSGNETRKKTRYVLFVGNIPYSTTIEDIKNHFLKEVSAVISVRIPTVKKSNEPRGFAYVEFSNSTDYEKGLSLHQSQFNGRRINVQYTQSGSKKAGKKSEIISKNQKLHALRKQGKLAGSKRNPHKGQRNFKKHLNKNKF